MRLLILFCILHSAAMGQHLIEGRILDKETQKPVPFASIGIVGTSRGTSSNLNGEFTLQLAEQGSIKISCIGYESTTLTVNEGFYQIELSPTATQLKEVVIYNKPINARRIVTKAFANIHKTFNNHGFMQKFFYRHYCMDDSVYGRLIEASVDIWKNKGYQASRKAAGEREEIRVSQLRRSLDKTKAASGHEPISIGSILQADFVGYQSIDQVQQVFYSEVSNVRNNLERYTFDFDGITTLDGQEVYKINFSQRTDSILTTSGYVPLPESTGSLFITTNNFAFVKTEEVRSTLNSVVKRSAYYGEFDDKYYPYHLLIEGHNKTSDIKTHAFHIELISVEIDDDSDRKFYGHVPSKDELLKIPYDSSYWKNSTVLKTTPLEESIIKDLGDGLTLNEQFKLYKQYQINTTNGGVDGGPKMKWFLEYSINKTPVVICFWSGNPANYIADVEYFKRLTQLYHNKIAFLFVGIENDEQRWADIVSKYNLFSDGILNYRIDSQSEIVKKYKVKETPTFISITASGTLNDFNSKHPGDSSFAQELNLLLAKD